MAKNSANGLDLFFHPRSVAIIGASAEPGKVGNDILLNIKKNFSGKIFPVNPKDDTTEGLPCLTSVLEIKEPLDLAVIVVPAAIVPAVLEQCGQQGCRNVIIISSGFKETGEAGAKLEQAVVKICRQYQINLLGPNCLGYISTLLPLNASFAFPFEISGNIAFISQSGALGVAVLDKAAAEKIGLAYFVSVGNKAGLDEISLLDYFSQNPEVKVVMLYLEDILAGKKFLALAQAVSKHKTIIILKGGQTQAGQLAAASHTGSLAGSMTAYHTAFKQAGLIEAGGADDFYNFAKGFSLQPLPAGNRVAIVTNAGGPGILVTDLLAGNGLELAKFDEQTKADLKAGLHSASIVHNPVDILGDAKSDRYALAVDGALNDSNTDAVIVVLTPQKMTAVEKTAEIVGELAKKHGKPVILCFMGEDKIAVAYKIFRRYSLPQFDSPDAAVSTLGQMYKYSLWQKAPLRIDKAVDYSAHKQKKNIRQLLAKPILTEVDCRAMLGGLKFPLYRVELAVNEKAALAAAKKIGYPVVLKVVSENISHKSDVGGVKVGIKTAGELKKALAEMKSVLAKNAPQAKIAGFLICETLIGFEVIMGVKQDPQFGPLVMVGAGGIYAEIFKDVSFRLAPFDAAEAEAMLAELKSYKLFEGSRGQQPLDIKATVNLLVKLGDFAAGFPEIKEIDFNPVMVGEKGKGCTIADLRFLK